MLKTLFIKNFALIEEVKVEFGQGLNIITGETGAGKSILLGALGLILGNKPDTTFIRTGCNKATVEVEFNFNENKMLTKKLGEIGTDQPEEVIMRREIPDRGRARAFLNDSPITTEDLITLGELIVDLHGQHDHQSLLRVENHITFLDSYAGVDKLIAEVSSSFYQFQQFTRDLTDLEKQEKLLREKKELLRFQIKEITTIAPQPEEEDTLLREEKILNNAEFLYQKCNELYQLLYDSEPSVYENISEAVSILNKLAEIDQSFTSLKAIGENAQIAISEISNELQKYLANFQFDPQRLEEIRIRLGHYSGLKKKYGPTIDEVINYRQSLERDLQTLERIDISKQNLLASIHVERNRYSNLSAELSNRRQQAAIEFEQRVSAELKSLGMPGVIFRVHVITEEDSEGIAVIDNKKYRSSPRGIDKIEFLFSANPGIEPRSLAKIASGGEISRVMLALKTVLAHNDMIPVLIFDEIDLGISGHIGQIVGKSLKKLSRFHQVICITHLPQIASMADFHYVVEKISDGLSVKTTIRCLEESERAEHIATLLGGEKITKAHLQSAVELLNEARFFEGEIEGAE